jgi:flap endonuclease-1
MGNADLRQLAAIEEVPFADVEGSVVAVDVHNWLYKYLTTTVQWTSDDVYTTAAGTEVANLVGVVQGLPKFFEHDLTPVFVWDGGVTELKDEEIEERRDQREEYEERVTGDVVGTARDVLFAEQLQVTVGTREEFEEHRADSDGEYQVFGSENVDNVVWHAPPFADGVAATFHGEEEAAVGTLRRQAMGHVYEDVV